MGLTQSQKAILAKAQAVGAGQQGIALSVEACSYLLAVMASDLSLSVQFPELPKQPLPFFGSRPLADLILPGLDHAALFERMVNSTSDADTFFHCLATLHKARLKFERIQATQAIPTIEQVGPRGLLQYGTLPTKALAGLLLWRKWVYDVDNRAAQETGYVFEPIVATAIGGVPVSASKSPIRRRDDENKGRQVDCIRPDNRAYEIKIRLTIAASGQGRWREEQAFPVDCRASGYLPVLVVLDPTPNLKLDELCARFVAEGGEFFVGERAWDHLRTLAGETMGRFLDIYVHEPINALLEEMEKFAEGVPDLTLSMVRDQMTITVGGDALRVKRSIHGAEFSDSDMLPDDVDEQGANPI